MLFEPKEEIGPPSYGQRIFYRFTRSTLALLAAASIFRKLKIGSLVFYGSDEFIACAERAVPMLREHLFSPTGLSESVFEGFMIFDSSHRSLINRSGKLIGIPGWRWEVDQPYGMFIALAYFVLSLDPELRKWPRDTAREIAQQRVANLMRARGFSRHTINQIWVRSCETDDERPDSGKRMKFPYIRPDNPDSSAFLWELQMELLSKAEDRFGWRDPSKEIGLPVFSERAAPMIMNTEGLKGAYAILSRNAAQNWPGVVYELAHETVHLLDPVVGSPNWIEEGVAVAFSIEMSKELTGRPIKPSKKSNYHHACELVKCLPLPLCECIPMIRRKFGKLSDLKPEQLAELFPGIDHSLSIRLCTQFSNNESIKDRTSIKL